MKMLTAILLVACFLGANAVSAQTSNVLVGDSSFQSQTMSTLTAGDRSYGKKTGSRHHRCPNNCN